VEYSTRTICVFVVAAVIAHCLVTVRFVGVLCGQSNTHLFQRALRLSDIFRRRLTDGQLIHFHGTCTQSPQDPSARRHGKQAYGSNLLPTGHQDQTIERSCRPMRPVEFHRFNDAAQRHVSVSAVTVFTVTRYQISRQFCFCNRQQPQQV